MYPLPLHCLHVHHLIKHLTDLLLLAPIQARRPLLPVVLDVRGEPIEYQDHQCLEEGDAAVEFSVLKGRVSAQGVIEVLRVVASREGASFGGDAEHVDLDEAIDERGCCDGQEEFDWEIADPNLHFL